MKFYILIATLLPALVLANQNSSLPKAKCPLEDIEFDGQVWDATSESSWQECAAGCMTTTYACNFWTWKAPTSCTLWSSTSGFHESEGVLSSAKDCPCHLEGISFLRGTVVATNFSPSPTDCGASCKDLETCLLWTWNRVNNYPNRNDCFLFSSVSSWYFRENEGAISGTKDCALWFKTLRCNMDWIKSLFLLYNLHCKPFPCNDYRDLPVMIL